jgi:hypothetical protein
MGPHRPLHSRSDLPPAMGRLTGGNGGGGHGRHDAAAGRNDRARCSSGVHLPWGEVTGRQEASPNQMRRRGDVWRPAWSHFPYA